MSLPSLSLHIQRLDAWKGGSPAPARELDDAIRDFEAGLATFESAGDRLTAASAAFFLSIALRVKARAIPHEAVALLAQSCATAGRGRDNAIADAERGGVNERNTSSYATVTCEAGHAYLALGEVQHGSEAEASFRQAASFFGEAAAGYRRLGSDDEARTAELKAVEARGRAALAQPDAAD